MFRHSQRSFIIRREYRVFTYIYSLLIMKDLCECQNLSVKLLCVFAFHLEIFSFFGKSFLLLFLFLCYPYFGAFSFNLIKDIFWSCWKIHNCMEFELGWFMLEKQCPWDICPDFCTLFYCGRKRMHYLL